MKSRLAVLLVFMMLGIYSNSQKLKDTLYFKNGSMVVGELKKIKMGVVTFDPDDANNITVQLRKIKAITANSDIFRVETIHKGVFFGFLRPDSIPDNVKVILGLQEGSFEIEEIFNLYPFSNKFGQRFNGSVGAGYSYSRSSGFGKINFDGTLNYNSKNHELKLATSGIYSQTDTGFTREREEINVKDNFYFSPRSFATALILYQRNLELGLGRRYQEGAGIGNKFVTTKSVYVWGRTGIVFNQEKSIENVYSGNLAEWYAQLQFNFFRFTKPEINLDFTQSFYYGLTDRGRVRNDGETNLSWEIIDDFKLNLNLYNNYDSKPPVKGNSNFDYGIVIGFQYTF